MQEVSPWDAAKQEDHAGAVLPQTGFSGRRWPLFWMALRLGVLTVLTLGFYRFWMKTRLRRWYWSAWRPGGHPLEYVGDPWEKLLGFLIVVVLLAFYIGIVNLLLMFASFSLFGGNAAAYLLSFLGVVPLWFFARYRARRYVLARTRWRGVRFGLEPGAWGFAVRALWHWFLTLLTLGLLWPRKAFYLEKYITDRTYFGAQRLHQNGRWFGLFWAWLGFWLPGSTVVSVLAFLGYEGFLAAQMFTADNFPGYAQSQPWRDEALNASPFVLLVAMVLMVFALINYNVKRIRYLASQKTAGRAALEIAPRYWKVTGIYLFGYFLATFVATVLTAPVAIGAVLIVESGTSPYFQTDLPFDAPSQAVFSALALALYFLVFLMWAALMHAFIRFPLMRHFASVLTIQNIDHLDQVPQRSRDEFAEAEGFAEALDVGSAI